MPEPKPLDPSPIKPEQEVNPDQVKLERGATEHIASIMKGLVAKTTDAGVGRTIRDPYLSGVYKFETAEVPVTEDDSALLESLGYKGIKSVHLSKARQSAGLELKLSDGTMSQRGREPARKKSERFLTLWQNDTGDAYDPDGLSGLGDSAFKQHFQKTGLGIFVGEINSEYVSDETASSPVEDDGRYLHADSVSHVAALRLLDRISAYTTDSPNWPSL